VERVEDLEMALAGNAEHRRHPERLQLINENAPAGPDAMILLP
jgi:hypothetical protein